MKLTHIKIGNFRLHADTQITFPETGIIGILGGNESGKSTILEAATWALFGGDATRGTKAGLRWHGAPARKTAFVELGFDVGGARYTVYRDENTARLYQGEQMMAEGVSALNKHVPAVLGLTYAEFCASFFVKQKDVDRLASMLPTERVGFIRSLMGMAKIDAALKACRMRKSALSQERDGIRLGLGERTPHLEFLGQTERDVAASKEAAVAAEAEVQRALVAYQGAKADAEASAERREQHRSLVQMRDNGTRACEAASIEVARLERKLVEIEAAHAHIRIANKELVQRDALVARRDELVATRDRLQHMINLQTRRSVLEGQQQELFGLILKAKAQIALYDVEADRAAGTALVHAQQHLEGLRRARLSRRATAEAAVAAARRSVELLEGKLRTLTAEGEQGACPTCGRALLGCFDMVCGSLQESISCIHLNISDLTAAVARESEVSQEEAAAEGQVAACNTELRRLGQLSLDAERAKTAMGRDNAAMAKLAAEAQELIVELDGMGHISFDATGLLDVQDRLKELDALDASLARSRALVAQDDETKDLLRTRFQMLYDAQRDVDTATTRLAEIRFSPEDDADRQATFQQASTDFTEAQIAFGKAQARWEMALSLRDDAQRALEAYDRKAEYLTVVEADHLTHERAASRLADFRVAVASTIRPEMEELMSGFIQVLTDGRHESVALNEDFAVTLHENGVPMEVVSGGAEDVAALAMRLALSQMIAERAGHPLSLLVLDEPFGSQDAVRRANVVTLIRRLKSVFPQVLVISHVEETRVAVDHAIELEFDPSAGRTRRIA